jgi:hypothetical protein
MAHFAELDNNNVVLRVVVVGNDCVPSDEHIDGEKWCINFFKTPNWKQTSYNHNFRKQYAGIGMTYDAAKNKFISSQPYASWALDVNDDWQCPVTYPTILTYENGTYTQADVDVDVYPVGHEQEGQRRGSFVVGDVKNSPYLISWDEENLKWTAKNLEDSINNFNWDASALAWVSA